MHITKPERKKKKGVGFFHVKTVLAKQDSVNLCYKSEKEQHRQDKNRKLLN